MNFLVNNGEVQKKSEKLKTISFLNKQKTHKMNDLELFK